MDSYLKSVFKGTTPQLKKEELAYFAGFFDGEGNIDIRHQGTTVNHPYEQFSLRVCVSQKDPKVLTNYNNVFGGNVYKPNNSNNQWVVYGKIASEFLKYIFPYIKLKKEECKIAIDFQKFVREHGGKMTPTPPSLLIKQSRLYQEFRRINPKRKKDNNI